MVEVLLSRESGIDVWNGVQKITKDIPWDVDGVLLFRELTWITWKSEGPTKSDNEVSMSRESDLDNHFLKPDSNRKNTHRHKISGNSCDTGFCWSSCEKNCYRFLISVQLVLKSSFGGLME
jgi:hypothetical protein